MARFCIIMGVWACLRGLSVSIYADIDLNMTTIGDPGNAPDHPGLIYSVEVGAVDYTYQISTYEVTVAQYVEFLNAKAASDLYGLYDGRMAGAPGIIGGAIINRAGEDGTYTYTAVSGRENQPVRMVNLYDGLRLANWLHNGQGDGDTEDGSYTLNGDDWLTRNEGATWALPSRDEWHKAAYYDPETGTYNQYPNGRDTVEYPTDETTPREMNFGEGDTHYGWHGSVYFTSIGETTGHSAYGVFDMGGNVEEWTDYRHPEGGNWRVICGGTYSTADSYLARDGAITRDPAIDSDARGLRLVYLIPEPETVGLALMGLVSCWFYRKRKTGQR